MLRSRKIYKNIKFSFIALILSGILDYVYRILFIRVFSSEYLGISSLFASIAIMLTLIELGFNSSLKYVLYKKLAKKSDDLPGIINYASRMYRKVCLISLGIGIGLLPFLKYVIVLPNISNIYLIYILFVIDICCEYISKDRIILLFADQKDYVIKNYKLIFSLINFSLKLAILFVTRNYILILISSILVNICYFIFIRIKTDRMYNLNFKEKRIDNKTKAIFKSNSLAVFINNSPGVIFYFASNLLINNNISLATLGIYSNYIFVSNYLIVIANVFYNALKASAGNYYNLSKKSDNAVMFDNINYANSFLASILITNFYLLCNSFISFSFGTDYLLSNEIVLLMSLILYISIVSNPIEILKESFGCFNVDKWRLLIYMIFKVSLMLLFTKLWNLKGMLLASFIADLIFVCLLYSIIIIRNTLKIKMSHYFSNYLKQLIITVMSVFVCYNLIRFSLSNAVVGFIIKGMLIATVTIAINILFSYSTPQFKYLVSVIKGVIHRHERLD